MSVETILNTIQAAGGEELEQLRRETGDQARAILAEAEKKAAVRHEEACRSVMQPVAGEAARRLHRAKLKALKIVGDARDEVAAAALAQTRRRLIELRHDESYGRILRRLTEEAVRVLGEEELDGRDAGVAGLPQVEVDLRDEPLLRRIVKDLAVDLEVVPGLNNWGGVIVRSGDGRVVVTNTLEERLERAAPYLRQELVAFFVRGSG